MKCKQCATDYEPPQENNHGYCFECVLKVPILVLYTDGEWMVTNFADIWAEDERDQVEKWGFLTDSNTVELKNNNDIPEFSED